VVVAALTDERHANKLYEVTPVRSADLPEAVNEIAVALGRPVRYTQIAPEKFAVGMRPAGVPMMLSPSLSSSSPWVLGGRNSQVMRVNSEVMTRKLPSSCASASLTFHPRSTDKDRCLFHKSTNV
jgi:hypothetical protein